MTGLEHDLIRWLGWIVAGVLGALLLLAEYRLWREQRIRAKANEVLGDMLPSAEAATHQAAAGCGVCAISGRPTPKGPEGTLRPRAGGELVCDRCWREMAERKLCDYCGRNVHEGEHGWPGGRVLTDDEQNPICRECWLAAQRVAGGV